MDASLRGFMRATRTNEEEARKILDICEWNAIVAAELFSLHPRVSSAALLSETFFMLERLPLDVRKRVLDNFMQFFPRDIFLECSQGLDAEDCEYLSIVALRAFANSSGTVQHEEFAQALQLGRTIVLPLFQEWKNELREMMKAGGEDLDWKAPRERLQALINQTLPSVEETNAGFCGLVEDVINLHVSFSDENAQTALHVAAHLGDVKLFTGLIECNAKFDAKDSNDNTVLHLGVDHFNIVEEILSAAEQAQQQETFVEQVNRRRHTALHLCRNAESARLLLQASPNLAFSRSTHANTLLHYIVDFPSVVEVVLAEVRDAQQLQEYVGQVDGARRTALHYCTNAESARMLLRISPRLVFAGDIYFRTALHKSVNYPGVVEVILAAIQNAEHLDLFVKRIDFEGQTALHFCSNAESAQLLLRVCPDLLFAANKWGESALHLNVNIPDVVKELLNAAREDAGQLARLVEQVDENGQTALHVCRDSGIARLLVEVSPKVASIQCKLGCTPLHVHALLGLEDCCRFLIDYCGADVNAVNAKRQTPFHFACFSRHVETATLLLQKSTCLLARDDEQRTVLHYVLMEGNCRFAVFSNTHLQQFRRRSFEILPIVDLLLRRQDDEAVSDELVMARDVHGRTALHYCMALSLYEIEIADLLMMAGADGAAQDEQGDTAMHLVARKSVSITLYLIKHWGLSAHVKNRDGKTALDLVADLQQRKELQRTSILSCAVTFRFATRNKPSQVPWKRLPRELFGELCSFLI